MQERSDAASEAERPKERGSEGALHDVGLRHAKLRLEGGLSLDQLVAEYAALRLSVLTMCSQSADRFDLEDVLRFDGAIDEALMEAATSYTTMVDRQRAVFLGVLGHDLRNPLDAIVMGASLLERDAANQPQRARIGARIERSARRMGRLLDDLLDLTRARTGTGLLIERQPMDLVAVCREVVDELRTGHPGVRLAIESDEKVDGEWDPARLAQVVSNLAANAIQHGARDGSICVQARRAGDEAVLSIHNEGPAIPESAIPTLFHAMTSQAEPDAASAHVGLGLYIVEQIVTAHGGSIEVASTEAEGTTFTVHLPRRASRTHTQQAAEPSSSPG
jgi:signal transduction histidine kinase